MWVNMFIFTGMVDMVEHVAKIQMERRDYQPSLNIVVVGMYQMSVIRIRV
jgi:hypothetical protein